METFKGKTALITGASSGIGEAIARQLADLGCHLILVARRETRLQVLAQELNQVRVDLLPEDLAGANAAQRLYDQVQALGRQVDILINNAGFGFQKPFTALSAEQQLGMVDVNVRALLALTHAFAPAMAERGYGWVLNVGSVASWIPIPGMATYAASKAFVLSLSRALREEWQGAGIRVTALCPGGTRTEFSSKARSQLDPNLEKAMMSAQVVARAGLQGLAAGKAVVVPGTGYKVLVVMAALLPGGWLTRLAGRVMGRHQA